MQSPNIFTYPTISPAALKQHEMALRIRVFRIEPTAKHKHLTVTAEGSIHFELVLSQAYPLAAGLTQAQAKQRAKTLLKELHDNMEAGKSKRDSTSPLDLPPDMPNLFHLQHLKLQNVEPVYSEGQVHPAKPKLVEYWKATFYHRMPVGKGADGKTIYATTAGQYLSFTFKKIIHSLDAQLLPIYTAATRTLQLPHGAVFDATTAVIYRLFENVFLPVLRTTEGEVPMCEGAVRGEGVKELMEEKKGIFIYGLKSEQQINMLFAKIQTLVPEMVLGYRFQKIGSGFGKGLIYRKETLNTKFNPITRVIALAFDTSVRLMNDSNVAFYDQFNGNNYQLININQWNDTTQEAFFIYTLTHVIREYLWAVELNITEYDVNKNYSVSYEKAHNKTLLQDLEIFSTIIQTRYIEQYRRLIQEKTPNQDISDIKWDWWEVFNRKNYLRNTSLKDGPKKSPFSIIGDGDFEIIIGEVIPNKGHFIYLSFINIQSLENPSIDTPYEYDKIYL